MNHLQTEENIMTTENNLIDIYKLRRELYWKNYKKQIKVISFEIKKEGASKIHKLIQMLFCVFILLMIMRLVIANYFKIYIWSLEKFSFELVYYEGLDFFQ
jgi:hypothetical protein